MEILFLGTAAAEGIPSVFCRCETCRRAAETGGKEIRTRCSFLVNKHLMLDLSPDIMFHKLRYNLDLAAVDSLCITHSHTDHLNVPDLTFRACPVYAHIPNEKPLNIYANKKSCDHIRDGILFEFAAPEHPSFSIIEIAPGSVIKSGELKVTAFKAVHDPRENCLFFLVEEGEKNFLQINDSAQPGGEFGQDLARVLGGRKLNAVSMDCTHGREKGSRGHMGMEENIALTKRLLGASLADKDTLFFANHFSHNSHSLHSELSESLAPHRITPAWDGMILRV
jgi:phosphoribosyl 1,2-cyclic phosphate phosphodiesterase